MKNKTDEELKLDIQSEIESLLNRTKNLANMLNFNFKVFYYPAY